MKLSMACVAVALSLTAAACADDVSTSGNTEISVKDTDYKANQDPKARTLIPATRQGDLLGGIYNWNLIRFPSALGISAEELPPTAMNRPTGDIGQTTVNPAFAASPFQGDRVMDRSTDWPCATNYQTMAMNQNVNGDASSVTNGMSHSTTGMDLTHVVLIVQHDNNGTVDTASIMLEDGTQLCQIVQTRQAVISNTCVTTKKPPPAPLPGVGGC